MIVQAPPVTETPPAAPPVETPPVETPPAASERPEWLPENLWTDNGFNAEAFAQYRAPAADAVTGVDAYQLPTIEGVEIDASDPLIPILRARAFDAGMGQAAFQGVISDYVAKLQELDSAAHTAAIATIGDNATGRITSVSTWLDGKLPADEANALKAFTGDAKAMLGLERLMNSGVVQAPRVEQPAAPARKTHAEIRQLMGTKEYSGKPKDRSQAVVDEVTAWFTEEARLKAVAAAAAAPKP